MDPRWRQPAREGRLRPRLVDETAAVRHDRHAGWLREMRRHPYRRPYTSPEPQQSTKTPSPPSAMDWKPTTPRTPRLCEYPENHVPGGWINTPPKRNVFAIAEEEQDEIVFTLPPAKKICTGLAYYTVMGAHIGAQYAVRGAVAGGRWTRQQAVNYAPWTARQVVVEPMYAIVRRFRARQGQARRRTPLRESPFRRAVQAREGTSVQQEQQFEFTFAYPSPLNDLVEVVPSRPAPANGDPRATRESAARNGTVTWSFVRGPPTPSGTNHLHVADGPTRYPPHDRGRTVFNEDLSILTIITEEDTQLHEETDAQSDEEAGKNPTQQSVEQSRRQSVEQPAEQFPEQPIQHNIEQQIEKRAEGPIESNEETRENPTQQPVQQQPVEQCTAQPIQHLIEDNAEEPIDHDARESTDQAAGNFAKQSPAQHSQQSSPGTPTSVATQAPTAAPDTISGQLARDVADDDNLPEIRTSAGSTVRRLNFKPETPHRRQATADCRKHKLTVRHQVTGKVSKRPPLSVAPRATVRRQVAQEAPKRTPFDKMPRFTPPKDASPMKVRTPVQAIVNIPPACNRLEFPFPILNPLGVHRPQPPTPPDSPGTQLIQELRQTIPHDSDSDASSTIETNWVPARIMNKKRVTLNTSTENKSATPLSSEQPAAALPTIGENAAETPMPVTALPEGENVTTISETSQPVTALPQGENVTMTSQQTTPSRRVQFKGRSYLEVSGSDISSTFDGSPGPTPQLDPAQLRELEQDIIKVKITEPTTPTHVVTPKAKRHSSEKTGRITRAQKKQQEAREDAKNYGIKPLSATQVRAVEEAVRNGHGKFSATDLARVVPRPGAVGTDLWLNDETLNGYLELIVAHGKRNDRDGQVASHHSFNSFFYENLKTKGPESVRRWAQRAKIGGKNLLHTKFVFVPINSGMHWTLAVVSGEDRTITHYNSLPGDGRRHLSAVQAWVKSELGSAWDEAEWTVERGPSPQQTNSDDCGVFAVTNARQLMLGLGTGSFGAGDVRLQRQRIVAELVAGRLLRSD